MNPGTDKDKPFIVFAGRSNVGKSSTVRELTGKKVRIGKRPGSTKWEQLVDVGPFVIVDLAGFGYMAGQSKTAIEEMKTSLIQKLEKRSERIILSVLITDISLFRTLFERWDSRGEIPVDVEFYSFLSEISPEVIIVANKSDKLRKKDLPKELEFMREKMRKAVPGVEPRIIVTAASKRDGIDDLRKAVEKTLELRKLPRPQW